VTVQSERLRGHLATDRHQTDDACLNICLQSRNTKGVFVLTDQTLFVSRMQYVSSHYAIGAARMGRAAAVSATDM
jgi:hypothetical protein